MLFQKSRSRSIHMVDCDALEFEILTRPSRATDRVIVQRAAGMMKIFYIFAEEGDMVTFDFIGDIV